MRTMTDETKPLTMQDLKTCSPEILIGLIIVFIGAWIAFVSVNFIGQWIGLFILCWGGIIARLALRIFVEDERYG